MTSGGDAPGMNTAIRAATKVALEKGLTVFGVKRGYLGMFEDEIFEMDSRSVSGIVDRGGTVLLSARLPEFKEPSIRKRAVENLLKRDIDSLIVIGGDGSYRGADLISKEYGINVVGVPGTIDNDISGTDHTIGYDTALNTMLDAISKLRDTASSHERTYLLEVMGRDAGDLAMYGCLAGGGDGLLIPEKDYDIDNLAELIRIRRTEGKIHDIVLIAEGVGNANEIMVRLKTRVNTSVRVTVLGHLQRGGTPSALDRILATKMSAYAVEQLVAGNSGIMIGISANELVTHPISYAWEFKRKFNEADYQLALTLAK